MLFRLQSMEKRICVLEVGQDVATKRIAHLEGALDAAGLEKEKLMSQVFLEDMYLWLRDTVLSKSIVALRVAGKLVPVDTQGDTPLRRYLPSVINYVVHGNDRVFYKFRADLEANL